jgi:hypothetical protein
MQTSIDAAREARKPTESSRLAKAAALVAGTTLATLAGAAIAAGQPQGQMASDRATRERTSSARPFKSEKCQTRKSPHMPGSAHRIKSAVAWGQRDSAAGAGRRTAVVRPSFAQGGCGDGSEATRPY